MNTQFLTYAKKNINLYLALISVLILFFTYSCKDEASILGADLLPDDDRIELIIDTTLTFNGFLLDKEEYSTKYYSSLYLGQINDPYFGITSASFASQYILTSTSVTFVSAEIDSVVLYLAIDSMYGDFDKTKEVLVYKLSKDLYSSSDSIYLSSTPLSNFYNSQDLISSQTSYQGDTLVKVKLINSFGELLIPPADSIYYYRTVDKFLEKYKGIAVAYNEPSGLGGLLKLSTSSENTEIVLYYKKPDLEGVTDTLTYSYKFNTGVRYNNIQHDYTAGIINEYIENDSSMNDSLLFIQGLGGITSKLVLSNFSNFSDKYKYSILTAELHIPVFQDNNISSFVPPSNLFFIYSDSDSNLFHIDDYASGKFFSGGFSNTYNEYKFDISRHLKNILNNQIEDSTLYIRILNSSSYPHRVILKTGENIKLKVTYTKH